VELGIFKWNLKTGDTALKILLFWDDHLLLSDSEDSLDRELYILFNTAEYIEMKFPQL